MGDIDIVTPAERAERIARAKEIVQEVATGKEIFRWPRSNDMSCPDCPVTEVEEVVFSMAHEVVLNNEQLAFIAHMALTAAQTAVPYDAKQQMLHEIAAACRGTFPDWWDSFKRMHNLNV